MKKIRGVKLRSERNPDKFERMISKVLSGEAKYQPETWHGVNPKPNWISFNPMIKLTELYENRQERFDQITLELG